MEVESWNFKKVQWLPNFLTDPRQYELFLRLDLAQLATKKGEREKQASLHTTKLLWNILDIWWDWSKVCIPRLHSLFSANSLRWRASRVSESRIRLDKALSTSSSFSLPAFPFGKLTVLYGGPECEEVGSISLSSRPIPPNFTPQKGWF